jgi:PAS domain-containing protein
LPVSEVDGRMAGFLLSYGTEPPLASIRYGSVIAHFLATVSLVLLFGLHFRATRKIAGQLSFERQLLETIPITLKDRDGVMLNCNQAFVDLLRLPREKIIGRGTDAMAAPEAVAQQQALDRKVMALTTAASLLRATFRQADILARLGGDEFAVFLSCKPRTDSEQAILARLEANIIQENKGGARNDGQVGLLPNFS